MERRLDFPYRSDWNEPSEDWETQNYVSPLTRWSVTPPKAGRFEEADGRVFFVPEQEGPVQIQAVYAGRVSNRLHLFVENAQTPLSKKILWETQINVHKIIALLTACLLLILLIALFRMGRKQTSPSSFHVNLINGSKTLPILMEVGDHQASNHFVGGQRIDVTDATRWSVDPSECGRVHLDGNRAVFEAVAPGQAVIKGDYLGRSGETIHLSIEEREQLEFLPEDSENEGEKSD